MATREDWYYEPADSTQVELPTRLKLPVNHIERLRQVVRQELSRQAADEGQETFEEADDFTLEDDEWTSPYEVDFDPLPPPAEPVPPLVSAAAVAGTVPPGAPAPVAAPVEGVKDAKP